MKHEHLKRWSIDVESMEKGYEISIPELERLVGVNRDHPKFQLKVMNVCEFIRRELRLAGKDYTVAQVKGAVKILTDSEAVNYHDKGVSSSLQGLVQHHHGLTCVDVRNIGDMDKKSLERSVDRSGRALVALANAKVIRTFTPYERTTPRVLG